MKKIVSNITIVGSQLLVGGLFLGMLFSGKPEDDMAVVVKNRNMNRMSDVVTTLFLEDEKARPEEVATDVQEELKNEEETPEEVVEEQPPEETVVPEEPPVQEKPEVKEEPPAVEVPTVEVPAVEVPVKKSLADVGKGIDTSAYAVIRSDSGTLTGYGPDCNGCSGKTASGHNANASATYVDSEFGEIRILAGDGEVYPINSIVRVTIPGQDAFLGIVLDKGGAVGFGKSTLFDLLFESESQAMPKTYNVLFERIR